MIFVQAGSVVVAYVSSPMATWTCLVLLLSIHLATNHAAVRAVSMHTLNRQRGNILLSNLLDTQKALTPEEVSIQERVFEWDGVLRWRCSSSIATAKIGVSLQRLLGALGPAHDVTGAIRDGKVTFQRLARIFSQEEYLIWYDASAKEASIVLKEQASPQAQIKAWTLSLMVAHRFQNQDATGATTDKILQMLNLSLMELSIQWGDCIERMRAAGWDIDIANLETTSGTRIRMHEGADMVQKKAQK